VLDRNLQAADPPRTARERDDILRQVEEYAEDLGRLAQCDAGRPCIDKEFESGRRQRGEQGHYFGDRRAHVEPPAAARRAFPSGLGEG
jgi:hypothetical protein